MTDSTTQTRRAGVVLHPTSLPGKRAIGSLGKPAHDFIQQLVGMGCDIWQVLPLGPTSYGDSPYSCLSSFAGNPFMIDLDDLVAQGLLDAETLEKDYPQFNPEEIDYGQVFGHHNYLLDIVTAGFEANASDAMKEDLKIYRSKNADWLNDFALYMALKNAHEGRAWPEWDAKLVARDADALAAARKTHAAAIAHHEVLQYLFSIQWQKLHAACTAAGVEIMGDIPIFVAHDSADVWANQDLFHLDDKGYPVVIAGVPPDYFSETGQRWGNPLYRWDKMESRGYAWWCKRMETVMTMVDLVRIDHFRGFESYWEIPASEETAINGQWVPGPGKGLFEAFAKNLGEVHIIAEDLGVITPEVEALRDDLALPGMKVLQFILGCDEPEALPHAFPIRSVCYTGTHDNDTTTGWFHSAADHEREAVKRHLQTDGAQVHLDFLHAAWNAPSYIAVAPMQDILGLGSEARLNLPGRPGGNWRWRLREDQLTQGIVAYMQGLSKASGRLPKAT